MAKIMEIISKETGGKSYNTEKYSYDTIGMPSFDYDDDGEKFIKWQVSGETEKHKTYVDLTNEAKRQIGKRPVISYFLDGSRHTYKVDDISYNKKVYPVIAGQVGIGCCKRTDGRMRPEKFYRRLVLSLPTVSNADGWKDDVFFAAQTKKLNKSEELKKLGIEFVYGDNVFEKDGIRRDRTGDGEKTRCLCGKRGIFNRDGPAMGPQIIRQLERRASRRSASFFHALASPGRPRNGGGASGAYQPAEGRKALIQGRFRAQEGPLGPSRKSQQQTKRTGFAALEDSIADEAPEGKRAKRANRALNRAGINSRGQKQGFGGADRRAGRVTSR